MSRTRLLPTALVVCAGLALLAGCGGGSGTSGGPAGVAPPQSSLFVEGTIRPTGPLKSKVEGLAKDVAGVEDLGQLIVSKLESTAGASGESFNYPRDVKPWLGEKAGIAFGKYDGKSFSDLTIAVQSTDTAATESFLDKLAEEHRGKVREGSYEGVDFKIEPGEGTALGVIGEFLVIGEGEASFKQAVDASKGESLADLGSYQSAASHAPAGSLLDAYVDVGGLVEQAGNEVDPQTEEVLKAAGIELNEATALVSVVPGENQIEIDVASAAGKELLAPAAESLLESLPAKSFAAFASSGYGKRVKEGIDTLDANGIPGKVPPHQLKSALKKVGINLDQFAGSLQDAALFAAGRSRTSLAGAAVLTTTDPAQAKSTVADIGLLLRANHTPGVTAIGSGAAGFSIHSSELGPKPLVIAAKGERIAIGYGLPATLQGLSPAAAPLSDSAAFQEAKKALGATPIGGFIAGRGALGLAEALVSPLDRGFTEARPLLAKIGYLGFGSTSEGGVATLKLIAGLAR